MRKHNLWVPIALLALIGVVIAQPVTWPTLNGTEVVRIAASPGGMEAWGTVNDLRNTTGKTVVAAATGTITQTADTNLYLVNAQPANPTVFQTPSGVVPDGALFSVCNVTASPWATNTSSVQPASGQTIQGGNITTTTLAANTCVSIVYQLSTTTWYRIR